MNITDKIQSAEFIYSTFTRWGLKKYICDVEFYTKEDLNDLYFVICSILDTNGGIYDKRSLGVLLGFSMYNHSDNGSHDMYYDVAEVRMFEDILAEVEKEHLIKIAEHDIILTELGRLSLQENSHYHFFQGTQVVYKHLKLKSDSPTALLMFPFYKDMGVGSTLITNKLYWPEDEESESNIFYEKNQLIKRLENHSAQPANIYYADQEEYFDVEIKKIQVNLYSVDGEYMPIVMNGDEIAEQATKLILDPLNSDRKDNLILECLFQKLWDDKNSILNYESLSPYFKLVDFEELTKDSRTVWTDNQLFNVIIKSSNQTCWRNISRFCDLKVLYANIDSIKEKIDWPIFTRRVDDSFLIGNFEHYPWDLEILSGDNSREINTIEQLILKQKETEEDWNWDFLEQRLSSNFVLAHLDVVKVDLSSYTKDTPNVRESIIKNNECRWDWEIVEKIFGLDFILINIAILGSHFNFYCLLDRVFKDEMWSERYVCDETFVNVIRNASKGNGPLVSCILNDKDYVWNTRVIDLFMSLGLISWSSTPYMKGFECNPALKWDSEFFEKYSCNIETEEGRSIISKSIVDLNIILNNPEFKWSWKDISSNRVLISDIRLYEHYGDKLIWNTVLHTHEDIDFIQGIEDIESMIADDETAWSTFSERASIKYVITQYKAKGFPWDWTILTARMFDKLKLENIGNPLFINKWDWDYLSEHIENDFLWDNLEKYNKYWNWEIILKKILTSSNRLDFSVLDNIAIILTKISDKERRETAWSAFTRQYSFKELKKLIKGTTHRRSYWWDINYFCQHEEFNVFTDLENFYSIIDWGALSSSKSVDKSFKFNPKLKIKPKAWNEDIMKLLSDSRYKWNFKALSTFDSLRDQRWFLSRYKDKIDWEYLSKNSKIFVEDDKQRLNDVIEAYKKYIDFKALSERTDVNIEQIIKIQPKADYDYNALIERGVVKINIDIINEMPDYNWNYYLLTSSVSFKPTVSFLEEKINEELNWSFLTNQENNAWGDEGLLLSMAKDTNISEKVNWRFISEQKVFPLNKELLLALPWEKINWKHISARKDVIKILDDFKDVLDWCVLSANKSLFIENEHVLYTYKNYLHWNIVCNRDDFTFSNDTLEKFADYIDWDKASSSLNIQFSKELVDKYQERWNWPVLVKNRAFNNKVDVSKMPYARQINIVDFINHFPRKPQAFHFTHMSNALKIIRNMKLQSRNYAEGNFTNSAGSNVHRTAKAHRFARFYFMPKSPTQFYNECLGKDKGDKYYMKARKLGLPKCPLPVFFVFDVEELLMTMPDKCYYSTGNMQKDSSRSFKIIEDPNRIKAREIYINSNDTFDERQQEFLVEGELDFSKLKKVQIICYDSFQADMLRNELIGTQWEDIITTNENLYEHCNKELKYDETQNSIRISTNGYRSSFEFKVVYHGNNVPSIVNKNMVLRQRDNSIYLQDSVELSKDVPFDVYFETKDPRIESWLIYKNR